MIKIDQYLSGELSPAEQEAFEKQMAADADLREQVSMFAKIDAIDPELLDLQKQLDAIHEEVCSTSSPTSSPLSVTQRRVTSRRWIQPASVFVRYAAAVVFVLLFVRARSIDTVVYPKLDGEQLINLYFNCEPSLQAHYRAPLSPDELLIIAAEDEIKAGNYTNARAILQKVVTGYPQKTGLEYYIAICDFKAGNYAQAALIFEQLNKKETSFKQSSQYYLAGAYMLNGDEILARAQLINILENPEHYYNKNAKELFVNLEY